MLASMTSAVRRWARSLRFVVACLSLVFAVTGASRADRPVDASVWIAAAAQERRAAEALPRVERAAEQGSPAAQRVWPAARVLASSAPITTPNPSRYGEPRYLEHCTFLC